MEGKWNIRRGITKFYFYFCVQTQNQIKGFSRVNVVFLMLYLQTLVYFFVLEKKLPQTFFLL